jgi:hypothetical protein
VSGSRQRLVGRLLGLASVLSLGIALLFAFLPQGDCGSVVSEADYGGTSLAGGAGFYGRCMNVLGVASQLMWLFLVLFLLLAIISIVLTSRARAGREGASMAVHLDEDSKICPSCAEVVRARAIVCKHCGREIAAEAPR